jgi:hypothetical protein
MIHWQLAPYGLCGLFKDEEPFCRFYSQRAAAHQKNRCLSRDSSVTVAYAQVVKVSLLEWLF